MNKLFLAGLFGLLSPLAAHAAILGAPYIPEIDARFDSLEQGQTFKQGIYPQGSADGPWVKHLVKATYDFTKQGGAVGNHSLGVSIPAKSIETRTLIYSVTQPTTSASGTLAFYCVAPTIPELKASLLGSSYPAANASVIDGLQDGTAAKMSVVTTACTVGASIGTGALTAGKVVIWVEFLTHQ